MRSATAPTSRPAMNATTTMIVATAFAFEARGASIGSVTDTIEISIHLDIDACRHCGLGRVASRRAFEPRQTDGCGQSDGSQRCGDRAKPRSEQLRCRHRLRVNARADLCRQPRPDRVVFRFETQRARIVANPVQKSVLTH